MNLILINKNTKKREINKKVTGCTDCPYNKREDCCVRVECWTIIEYMKFKRS